MVQMFGEFLVRVTAADIRSTSSSSSSRLAAEAGEGGMEAWAVDTNRQRKKREGAPFPLPAPTVKKTLCTTSTRKGREQNEDSTRIFHLEAVLETDREST